LLPFEFLQDAQKKAGVRSHNCLYSALVVLWLLVLQRLYGGVPLEAVVLELLRGLPASFWPNPCKRVRDWQQYGKLPSHHAGAYCQARQAISSVVVQQASDRICSQLMAEMGQDSVTAGPRAFILDGSSVRLPHTPSLCNRYPTGKNQHGEMHFPVLRILVAHDLYTGLAMRPEFGPMHGAEAISEQALLESAIGRLPNGSVLIGDANLGVFSVAYAATKANHPVLLRLTPVRARNLVKDMHAGIDYPIVWKPSRWDRSRHPNLPADACVEGRLIVRRVQPNDGSKPFLLYLFMTLPSSSEEALSLYGKRWEIETDLRTLKSTLRLDQLTCGTPDLVAKEIHMGIAAYNLVRAITCLAARQSGIPPRGYSFTSVRRIVDVFTLKIAEAPNSEAARQVLEQMMHCIHQAKLPHRRRKRPSYPRHVWRPQTTFPTRKS